jgi:hypothetical protein
MNTPEHATPPASDTPETDRNRFGMDSQPLGDWVHADVCESLERSLTVARKERDDMQARVTDLALALGMFDLALSRLQNSATRLALTRRDLHSDYQVAVLSSYLDELAELAKKPRPEWPAAGLRAHLTAKETTYERPLQP